MGAGINCYFATQLKGLPRVDDALDVWGVHDIGGTWGAIATGIFASLAVNPAGADGLVYGDHGQAGKRFLGVLASWVCPALATRLILKSIDIMVGPRMEDREEVVGPDATQHDEVAYRK